MKKIPRSYLAMFKFSLISILFCFASEGLAGTYYVDATYGNDRWSGLQPYAQGNLQGPWKTLGKVNRTALAPSDTIQLKCGGVWRESLIIQGTGAASAPITLHHYGSNCTASNRPVINAAQQVTGWQSVAGSLGLYVTSVVTEMNQVFIDGLYLNQAKFPQNGFLPITADTQLCAGCSIPYNYLIDGNLALTADQVTGAYVHIRINEYIIDDFTATTYDATAHKIALSYPSWFTEASRYAIAKDWGYYLTNKKWMLNSNPGWAYEAGQLYLRLPDGSHPRNHLIEISKVSSVGIKVTGQPINIDGIAVKNAGDTGISLINPSNFSMTNVNVSHSGHTGIRVDGANTATGAESGLIQGCSVSDSIRRGISTYSQTNTSILDNTVTNTGTVGWPQRSYGAIWSLISDNNVIQNNFVSNSGYIGIQLQYQENPAIQNALVKNNVVEDSCKVLDDCGAIYIQGYGSTFNDNLPKQYSKIIGNIVKNATGNQDGRPANVASTAEGIYLDDYTNQVEVSGNTVMNADWGVYLHNAFDNVINNNTTYYNRQNEIAMHESGASYPVPPIGVMKNNQVTNNIFFPLNSSATILQYSDFNTSDFAQYDRNFYTDLYSDNLAHVLSLYYSFPEWQQKKSMDQASALFSKFRIMPYQITNVLSENLVANASFDTDVSNWTAWNSIYGWTTNCVSSLSGGCLSAANQSNSTSLATSNPFTITQGKTYLLEFKIASTMDNQTNRAIVRRNGGAYESLGLDKLIQIGTAWKKFAFVFTAATSAIDAGRIDFELSPGQKIYIDNVSLKETTAEYHTDVSNDSRILINKGPAMASQDCPDSDQSRCGQYSDLHGDPVSWPVQLAPYGSMIVIWTGNPWMDNDRDYVPNSQDACPNSVHIADVDSSGCAAADAP